MFRLSFTSVVEVMLILFILQGYFHHAFSNDELYWCENDQEDSRVATHGQPVYVKFHFTGELQQGQHFVWTKADSELELPINISVINNTFSNFPRLSLTYRQEGNGIFQMSILLKDSEKSDTGKHAININDNGRYFCTIFVLHLTVKETKPICERLFHKETSMLQMSCKWVQVNNGDRVMLVAADRALYEHVTSEVKMAGQYNITNKYSIFIPPEKLNDASMLPSKCVVFNSKTNRSSTCRFPTSTDQKYNNLTTSSNALDGHSTCSTIAPADTSLSPTTAQASPTNLSSAGGNSEEKTSSNPSRNDRNVLIPIVIITSLAFALSIGFQFVKCKIRESKRYDRQNERDLSFRANSPTTSANMEAESVEMTSSTRVPRNGQNRHISDGAELGRSGETVPSYWGRQAIDPVLPARHDVLSTPCLHNISNPGSQGYMAGQCPIETGCFPRAGDRRNVHGIIDSNVNPSTPSLDNIFNSLGDVGGATALKKATDSLVVSQRFGGLKCPFTPVSENSSSSFPAGNRKTSSLRGKPGPSAGVEHLYAKPDMSRKTKKMTRSESDYDDPRDPGEEFWRRVLAKDKSLS